MNRQHIEFQSRQLLKNLWENKAAIWPSGVSSLVNMIDPRIACEQLGISVEEHEGLGRFGSGADKFEVAGSLDRQRKKILISNKFPLESRRFTLAHELGHWILHPDNKMHRDRPINGLNTDSEKKPLKEREADYFAACFLMPRKTVISEFKKRFGDTLPFRFDEQISFWLGVDDSNTLIYADPESLDRELALTNCRHYRMRGFNSLAQCFKVSSSSMAIRLSELKLIHYP